MFSVSRRRIESWGESPDITDFCGRELELSGLKEFALVQKCRVISILGIGGVGKTMLATKLAVDIAPSFDCVVWRTLRNEPTLDEFIIGIIHVLAGDNEPNLPPDISGLIDHLLDLLQSRRCLLLIDNIESVMQSGEHSGMYRSGFEGYGRFFRLAGESVHRSCFVLTSREKPAELARLEGYGSYVCSLRLGGVDTPTAKLVLAHKELVGTKEEWNQIVHHFSGNLMALQFASESIRELYDSRISQFLDDTELLIFSDIHHLLEQQFQRLSEIEQELLYWFAVERDGVGLARMRENLVGNATQRDIQDAIQSLHRRALIEPTKGGFVLQTIVLDFVTQKLVEDICAEIRDGDLRRLNSHALLKAQSKDYVQQVQRRLYLKPIANYLQSIFRNQQVIERHLGNLLESLRDKSSMFSGYAGGNIFNLLRYLNADMSKFDFSKISIWQAFMAGEGLQDTNFANADLRHSVFTEVFDRVRSLSIDAKGEMLATGTVDGNIRLWQIFQRRQLMTLTGHTDWVRSVTFSPDNTYLYSCSDDQSVKQWEVNTGQCMMTLRGHSARVVSVAISSDGKTLASASEDRTIRIWDTKTGQIIRVLQDHIKWVWSVVFSPDGQYLISGSSDCTVRVWRVASGECIHKLEGHTSWIWSVAISPDGKRVVSCGHDQTIRIWDMESEKCIHLVEGHEGWVWCTVFSPDGDLMASGSSDRTIKLWDVKTGELVSTLYGHTGHAWALAFSPDGQTLISSSEDRSVRFWDIELYQPIGTLYGYNGRIETVASARYKNLIVSGGEDQVIRLWDAEDGHLIRSFKGHTNQIWSVAFSPDGNQLLSGSADKSARIWDTKTGECLFIFNGHASGVRAQFSHDGMLIATGSFDTTVRLWDGKSGECISTLRDVDRITEICSIAFSPSHPLLVLGCEKGKIWIWDFEKNELRSGHQNHSAAVESIVFSLDGEILISGSSDGHICLSKIENNETVHLIDAYTPIRAVAVSFDGTMLASGGYDHKVRLWDIASGQMIKELEGHKNTVFSLAFCTDGNLVSGSQDETVRVWDSQTGINRHVLMADRVYERMNIIGATGLTPSQRESLKVLGAIGS